MEVNFIPQIIKCGNRQLCDICGKDISNEDAYQCLFQGDGMLTLCKECAKNSRLEISEKKIN